MGRDKAQILVGGKPLWSRQLQILAETAPIDLFISGDADGRFRDAECRIIPDLHPCQGPLGGIAAVLRVISTEWLLVLAVDVGNMTADFLRVLLQAADAAGQGRVCALEGQLEPLVAVYPHAALPFAEEQLSSGNRKLGNFIEGLEVAGLMGRYAVPPEHAALFANWNTPADLPAANSPDAGD
jgi:molybdenum cofactor guanylyltransferase